MSLDHSEADHANDKIADEGAGDTGFLDGEANPEDLNAEGGHEDEPLGLIDQHQEQEPSEPVDNQDSDYNQQPEDANDQLVGLDADAEMQLNGDEETQQQQQEQEEEVNEAEEHQEQENQELGLETDNQPEPELEEEHRAEEPDAGLLPDPEPEHEIAQPEPEPEPEIEQEPTPRQAEPEVEPTPREAEPEPEPTRWQAEPEPEPTPWQPEPVKPAPMAAQRLEPEAPVTYIPAPVVTTKPETPESPIVRTPPGTKIGPPPPTAASVMSTRKQESTEDGGTVGTGGPGDSHQLYVQMEELLDKLKLLNYEQELLRKGPSHYFAMPTNPGEQFYMFTSVAAWLIQKAGKANFEMPQEYDDPNATISKILNELRTAGVHIDFPPNKLKSGAGENNIAVLDNLADLALAQTQFSWRSADPQVDDEGEAAAGADESELTAEQFEEQEEEPEFADDDDEGGFLDLHGLQSTTLKQTDSVDAGNDLAEDQAITKEILQSDTDALAWKLEVERILPSLKITIRQDAKDWRMHLEQMHQYRTTINETLKEAKPQLERLSNEIEKSMEKISSREKYLNTQLESLLSQFRSAQDRLAETKEKYREASGGVTERSKTLAQITDDLEQIKQDMEERGANLTDGAPLVKVKQSIAKLEQDLIGMDVQIGVVEQTLLQAQLRDRGYFAENMYGDYSTV